MAALAPSSSISFFSFSIFTTTCNRSTAIFLPLKSQRSRKNISVTIRSELGTLPVLSFDGTQVEYTTLNLKSSPPETARAVVHRGVTTELRNKCRGTTSTLTRSEVSGGGKKAYMQKKTVRARRGSQRTPLRPGGGVIFGPKPKDWSVKINKKEKRFAISTALASAIGNAIVVEDFGKNFEKPRTKEFIELMKRLGLDPKEKSLFLVTEVSENVLLSNRNIGTLKMLTLRTLNLFDILDAEKLVFTKESVELLNERYGYGYGYGYGYDYESEGNEDEDEG